MTPLRSHVGCHPDILKGVFATYESSTAVKEMFLLAATNTATRIDTEVLHLDGCWQAL